MQKFRSMQHTQLLQGCGLNIHPLAHTHQLKQSFRFSAFKRLNRHREIVSLCISNVSRNYMPSVLIVLHCANLS